MFGLMKRSTHDRALMDMAMMHRESVDADWERHQATLRDAVEAGANQNAALLAETIAQRNEIAALKGRFMAEAHARGLPVGDYALGCGPGLAGPVGEG